MDGEEEGSPLMVARVHAYGSYVEQWPRHAGFSSSIRASTYSLLVADYTCSCRAQDLGRVTRETMEIRIARVEFPSLGSGNFIERLRTVVRNGKEIRGKVAKHSAVVENFFTERNT